MGWVRASLFLFIGFAFLAPASALGEGGGSPNALMTPWPLEAAGLLEARADSGALLLGRSDGVAAARLVAERVTIEHAWERGLDVGGDDSVYQHAGDRDSEIVVLEDVEASFEPFNDAPILLAHAEMSTVALGVRSGGGVSLSPDAGSWLVQAGTAPDSTGALDAPDLGYWYAFEGPGVRGRASGGYSMAGTFTLFVHDVTIDALGRDAAWSKWTGYRESDPGAPASEYEFRVTTLRVENGTLEGVAIDAFDIYAPRLDAHFEGTLFGQGMSGTLRHAGKLHIFDDDPLRVEGAGRLQLEGEGSAAAPSRQGGQLLIGIEGTFDVFGAQTVGPAPGRHVSAGLDFVGWFSIAGLGLMGLGGLMVLGVVPGPTPRSRRRRHQLWMEEGARASQAEDWPRAVHCYRRATRLRRDDPLAWFRWAAAALENGEPATAEAVASDAAEVPGIDHADLLDLRAIAAWERGDERAFEDLLRALARVSPRMAAGLRSDLGLEPVQSGASSAGTAATQEGDLDGYA